MVQIAGREQALAALRSSFGRFGCLGLAALAVVAVLYSSCTARVLPNEWGVEQRRLGISTGIVEKAYGPGLYFVGIGATMHTFPREIHVLEASNDREESRSKARGGDAAARVDAYFDERDRVLGKSTHRVVEALNIQTSDGYAVAADVTLLYSIADPVAVAKQFGWGSLYVDSFV